MAILAVTVAAEGIYFKQRLILDLCEWPGHCIEAYCSNYNDCSGDLTCTEGKCAEPSYYGSNDQGEDYNDQDEDEGEQYVETEMVEGEDGHLAVEGDSGMSRID